jgi:hypothetical protein
MPETGAFPANVPARQRVSELAVRITASSVCAALRGAPPPDDVRHHQQCAYGLPAASETRNPAIADRASGVPVDGFQKVSAFACATARSTAAGDGVA